MKKPKFTAIPNWLLLSTWADDDGKMMSDSDFRVYLFIRAQARIKGYCHTSEKVMAFMLHRSKSFILRSVHRLEKGGWIEVDRAVNRENHIKVSHNEDLACEKGLVRRFKASRGGSQPATTPSGSPPATTPPAVGGGPPAT